MSELSRILTQYNAGYVLVRGVGETYQDRHGKTHEATGKEPKGNGWQRNPATLADAHKHAKRGGNVGLLGGHGGLILIDLDKDKDGGLALWPSLSQTIEVYRETAPDRTKFILKIDGPLPPSMKDKTSGTEILAAGSQGVIAGMHHTGAPILHRGDSILTVTADQVLDFWRNRTGGSASTPLHIDAGAPDDANVQHSMKVVTRVLDLILLPSQNWQPFDVTGRKLVLDYCPFNPTDNPHELDAAAVVVIGADGRIGATCHHARCKERIEAAGVSGWALLKTIAGYHYEVDQVAPEAPQDWVDAGQHSTVIEGLREWVRRADFGEFVPVMLQAENGYRTRNTDKRVAESILDIAKSAGRTKDLVFGMRKLRGLAGVGSPMTVAAALERLSGWFVVRTDVDAGHEDQVEAAAQRWTIAPSLVSAAQNASCVDWTLLSLDTIQGSTDKGCPIYATSPFATDRARDAFIAARNPMTRTELNERIEARRLEIEERKAASPWAFVADAPKAVQNLITALEDKGCNSDREALRNLTGMSEDALSAAIDEGCALGLLETNGGKLVRLKDEKLPEPINPQRYRRQLAATLPSAGTDVLLVIDALTTEGNELDRATLRKLTCMSKYALSRAVARGCELGLLETEGRHMVTLSPDWKDQVDRKEPCMPTDGLTLEREIRDIAAAQRWIDLRLCDPDLTEEEAAILKRRQARLTKQNADAIEERFGIQVAPEIASTPAPYGQGDTLQTQAQVIGASKPRHTLSETERFLLDHFGPQASEDVAAVWARFNSQMSAENGAGWWSSMSTAEIALEGAVWAAQGYGV